MEPQPRIDDTGEDAVARPWSARSLLPLAAAAIFFLFGVTGLTGLLPFVESSFAPSATPAPGALGRNPQPLATQVGASPAIAVLDFQAILDQLRSPFVLPDVAATATPEAAVLSAGSGSVRNVVAQEPTPTATATATATLTPTPADTPTPLPTPAPEPTATPTEAPFAPQPGSGGQNPANPEVAIFDPNPIATVAPDDDFSGYQTLPPPQQQESEE